MTTQSTALQLVSNLKRDGVLELSLAEAPIAAPREDEVVVRIEASPINPSDLGLLLAGADMSRAKYAGSAARPVVTAEVEPALLRAMAARLDQPLPVGNEGAGVVVSAGASPAAQALLGKTVDVASISISVAKPQIDTGNFIGLAVSGGERWPELPNVPTIVEAGFPAALADTWQGFMVPAGTPKDIVDRLAKATIEVVQRPDVRERLLKAGFHATGRGPDDFRKRIVEEVPKWKTVIEKGRIKAQ
jgi:hypothetical protein